MCELYYIGNRTFQSSLPYARITFVAFVLPTDDLEKSDESDIVFSRFSGR